MTGAVYPPPEAIIEAHARLLDRHGGAGGVRNPGRVEAALARGEQVRAYAKEPSICALAAAIGYAFARVHIRSPAATSGSPSTRCSPPFA